MNTKKRTNIKTLCYTVAIFCPAKNNTDKMTFIEKPERNLWSPISEVKKGGGIFVCELQECQGGVADFHEHFEMPLNYLGEIETRRKNRMIRNLQVYEFGAVKI